MAVPAVSVILWYICGLKTGLPSTAITAADVSRNPPTLKPTRPPRPEPATDCSSHLGSSFPGSSLLARPLIWAARGYQLLVSPLLGPRCRYAPSCSEYFIEAITRHGAVKGGWLGLKRLLRCHPWGSSGYDPVPSAASRPDET